jgi:hypothetical protein
MWPLEHLIIATILAAVAIIAVACTGFYLSMKKLSGHAAAGHVVNVTVSVATTIIFAIALNQLWTVKRDRDQRVWTARGQHLQRLQQALRKESESLTVLARGLREGRYFTLVANDARQAIWQDDVLTTDVERHFPQYFREREQLIRRILEYDGEVHRIRQVVSASLHLTELTEPYRSELVPALLNKCGGAGPGIALTGAGDSYTSSGARGTLSGSGSPPQFISMREAIRTFEQYRCAPDLSRACQSLLDLADDLADAASSLSEAARRYAEETVLHGSCTYAPAE